MILKASNLVFSSTLGGSNWGTEWFRILILIQFSVTSLRWNLNLSLPSSKSYKVDIFTFLGEDKLLTESQKTTRTFWLITFLATATKQVIHNQKTHTSSTYLRSKWWRRPIHRFSEILEWWWCSDQIHRCVSCADLQRDKMVLITGTGWVSWPGWVVPIWHGKPKRLLEIHCCSAHIKHTKKLGSVITKGR